MLDGVKFIIIIVLQDIGKIGPTVSVIYVNILVQHVQVLQLFVYYV